MSQSLAVAISHHLQSASNEYKAAILPPPQSTLKLQTVRKRQIAAMKEKMLDMSKSIIKKKKIIFLFREGFKNKIKKKCGIFHTFFTPPPGGYSVEFIYDFFQYQFPKCALFESQHRVI